MKKSSSLRLNFSQGKLTDAQICHSISDPGCRERAFGYLFKEWISLTQHPTIVYKYPGLTFEDRKDAFSDALIAFEAKVHKDNFELDKGSLQALFFTIYSNKCVDILRHKSNQKNKWVKNLLPLHEVLSDNARDFIAQRELEESFLNVQGKLNRMNPKSRDIITKAHLEGWSAEALAEEFGYKNPRSATQGLCNAMKNLRRMVGSERE